MPFSAGVYSLPSNSFAQPVTGTVISSTAAVALWADFATAFSSTMLKDGTQTLVGNIPYGGFKNTGMGAGTTAGDSVRYEQVPQLSVFTTKGDLLVATASATAVRQGVGTDGQAIVANSNLANGIGYAYPAIRSYLAGCGLSTAGSSPTMSIAAGVAVDSTNVSAMVVAAMSKTTSAWAVGTGNGGKMSAAALAAGTYHWYAIQRVDTGLVEAGFDVSATAPTMPTNYTLFRRIGSAKCDGTNWIFFVQDGDYFRLSASVLDVSDTNPGISAVTKALPSVPTGINVWANFNFAAFTTTGATAVRIYFSDLAAADEAPSGTAAPLAVSRNTAAADTGDYGTQLIRTNTSAQIRYRLDVSDGATVVKVATLGWYDRRGRDA